MKSGTHENQPQKWKKNSHFEQADASSCQPQTWVYIQQKWNNLRQSRKIFLSRAAPSVLFLQSRWRLRYWKEGNESAGSFRNISVSLLSVTDRCVDSPGRPRLWGQTGGVHWWCLDQALIWGIRPSLCKSPTCVHVPLLPDLCKQHRWMVNRLLSSGGGRSRRQKRANEWGEEEKETSAIGSKHAALASIRQELMRRTTKTYPGLFQSGLCVSVVDRQIFMQKCGKHEQNVQTDNETLRNKMKKKRSKQLRVSRLQSNSRIVSK